LKKLERRNLLFYPITDIGYSRIFLDQTFYSSLKKNLEVRSFYIWVSIRYQITFRSGADNSPILVSLLVKPVSDTNTICYNIIFFVIVYIPSFTIKQARRLPKIKEIVIDSGKRKGKGKENI
jgi:cadmium resistance protein CadD (predicted permease)